MIPHPVFVLFDMDRPEMPARIAVHCSCGEKLTDTGYICQPGDVDRMVMEDAGAMLRHVHERHPDAQGLIGTPEIREASSGGGNA